MQDIVEKISRIMVYLNYYSYTVPDTNLPLPKEADGPNYRENRRYVFYRDGSMTYMGDGIVKQGYTSSITIPQIKPDNLFISKIYICLIDELQRFMNIKTKDSNFKDIKFLLYKFNDLEFAMPKE